MKTRRIQFGVWLAALGTAVLAAGCGANTTPEAQAAQAPVPAVAGATNNSAGEPGADSAMAAVPADSVTNAPPAVKRSDRVLPPLRPEIAEVVRLVDSGTGEEVVKAFVSVSSAPYELTLEEIIYLRDIGVPDSVVAAMMRRGGELREDAENAQMQTNLISAVGNLQQTIAATGAPGAAAAGADTNGVDAATAGAPVPVDASAVAATASAPPADAPQAVQQFYTDLTPYGTWYQTPSYGWVWQPTVVVVDNGWRPYMHGGRWMWTDRGWYWCSDYSWGWAPFHYGRWAVYPGIGWCWVPDTVWGPSWVTWRHYDSYVGWAPLPPGCGWTTGVGLTWYGSSVSVGFSFGLVHSHYAFVSKRDFCHRNLHRVAVHGERGATIYNNSTVVNNVIVGNNNTIVNKGIGYTEVASQVRGEVPKARVEPLPTDAPRTLRADRPERSGDGTVIYKPRPVDESGGTPVAVRPEVRPSSTRSQGFAGTVPNAAPRTSTGGERGGGAGLVATPAPNPSVNPGGRPSYNQAATVGARPSIPTARPSAIEPRAPRTDATSAGAVTPKPIESRSTRNLVGSTPTAPLATPQRQTLPVPLGDPSRNLPNTASRSPRTVAPTAPTAPTANSYNSSAPRANERSGFNGNATANPYGVPSTPNRPQMNRPTTVAPMATPNRPSFSTPSPMTARPSYSTPSAPTAVPSAPRQNFTAPQAPRQTFSAPTPSVAAPRPSYSAPANRPSFSTPAPSMSAPRPSVSAPSAVGATPGPSTRSAGPRAQPN